MTSRETPIPPYVYKIIPEPPPTVLPHTLPLSDFDQKDGLIHLSDAGQIPKTAALFFKENSTLWVLKISKAAVEADGERLKWADELSGCIHLYGAKEGEMGRLGQGIVVGVTEIERKKGEDWIAATKDTSLE